MVFVVLFWKDHPFARIEKFSMADGLKAELQRLEAQRTRIEAEIAERSARLKAAGVGMESPLVDAEVCASRLTAAGPKALLFIPASLPCGSACELMRLWSVPRPLCCAGLSPGRC